jgi:hypothetical protein
MTPDDRFELAASVLVQVHGRDYARSLPLLRCLRRCGIPLRPWPFAALWQDILTGTIIGLGVAGVPALVIDGWSGFVEGWWLYALTSLSMPPYMAWYRSRRRVPAWDALDDLAASGGMFCKKCAYSAGRDSDQCPECGERDPVHISPPA